MVELLVVIGIIALLISILMPALRKARQAAQTVQCASNMKQIGLAWHIYASEHDGQLLKSGTDFTSLVRDLRDWPLSLLPYLNNNKAVFHCPADDNRLDARDYPLSYEVNLFVFQEGYTATAHSAMRLGRIRQFNEFVINGETRDPVGYNTVGRANVSYIGWMSYFWPNRHGESKNGVGGKHNILFADGHVESFPSFEIYGYSTAGTPDFPVRLRRSP